MRAGAKSLKMSSVTLPRWARVGERETFRLCLLGGGSLGVKVEENGFSWLSMMFRGRGLLLPRQVLCNRSRHDEPTSYD